MVYPIAWAGKDIGEKHMQELQVEIVEVVQLPGRYSAQDYGEQLSTVMGKTIRGLVMFSKELGSHHEGMRFC